MLGQKFYSLASIGSLIATLVLTGCGGGGGGSNSNPPPPGQATYTVGGTITGLTGKGLTLSLVTLGGVNGTQTVTVAPGASEFTFPTAFAAPTSSANYSFYEASVSAQPTDSTNTQDQTCLATSAYGLIHGASNVTSIQVTCTANTSSPLQGVYQVVKGGSPQPNWIAFSKDGTYILATIQNNTSCNENGNGVDYGTYNWNSTTGALQIQSALVYSLAPCGFTDATGAVQSTSRTLLRTGAGASAVLQLITGTGTNSTLVPVASVPGTLVGAYTYGAGLDQGLNILGNDGHYVNINTQTDTFSGAAAGIEYGCYTVSGSTITADTTSACSGAVVTAGTSGFTGGANAGATGTTTLNFTIPDVNTLSWSYVGYAGFVSTNSRFVPTADAGCCSPVTTGATIGGTVTGLTASSTPLVLQLFTIAADGTTSIQSTPVAVGASTFTFANAIPIPASASTPTYFEVVVAAAPTGPGATCVPTNAYGQIATAGNITTVSVACSANTTSPLMGVYQAYSDQAGTQPLQAWLAFSLDGTYIFGTIGNNTTCLENGNGVDYGAYSWSPTTGALVFQSAAVYSLAPCGFTNAGGAIDTSVTRNLTLLGADPSAGLKMVTTGGTTGTVYLLPVTTTSGTIVGAYGAAASLDQGVVVFFPVASGQSLGKYLVLNTQNDPATNTGSTAGLEYGCYSVTGAQLTIDVTAADCPSAILTAGTGGLSAGYTSAPIVVGFTGGGGNNLTLNFAPYNFVYPPLTPN